MDRGVKTGYTKCNDLSIHLESCGLVKEKKHKCTYEGCKASYVRFDNLKQHISKEHMKQYLYTCKKCNEGSSLHLRQLLIKKMCYTAKPADDYMEEDILKDDENGNGKGDDEGDGIGDD